MVPYVLQLFSIALLLGLYWRTRMNSDEQAAIARLEGEIGNLNKAHETQRAEIASLKLDAAAKDATVADLTAKLAAAQSDPSEVVTAINALSDKVDAELAQDAPPPATPPAVDPNAPAAS